MRIPRRRRTIAAAVAVAGVLVATTAVASIPDASNTIHGCYQNTGGALRVIDSAAPGASCDGAGETALNWGQTGPQGPQGAKGDTGPAGAAGAPGAAGAGVVAFRTNPDQKAVFVDEPTGGDNRDHKDTTLKLPAGSYAVFAHWTVSVPSTICFLVLHDGAAPIAAKFFAAPSDPAVVQYQAEFGTPEVARYGGTVEHGNVSVVGAIATAGYALVRCTSAEMEPITSKSSVHATITALKVGSTVVSDEDGDTSAPPASPSKGIALKALPKGTTALSAGNQSQLLQLASQGAKKPTRQQRARIVLLSTSGDSVAEVAATVGVSGQQVRKVVSAFARGGLKAVR